MNRPPAAGIRRLVIAALAAIGCLAFNGATHAAPAPQNVVKMTNVAAATEEALVINGAPTYNTGSMAAVTQTVFDGTPLDNGAPVMGLGSVQINAPTSLGAGLSDTDPAALVMQDKIEAVQVAPEPAASLKKIDGTLLNNGASSVQAKYLDGDGVMLQQGAVSFVLAAASEWPDLSVGLGINANEMLAKYLDGAGVQVLEKTLGELA